MFPLKSNAARGPFAALTIPQLHLLPRLRSALNYPGPQQRIVDWRHVEKMKRCADND